MDEDGTGSVALPPNDQAAEQACLGAMLLSQQAIEDVTALVEAGDYWRPAHGMVHRAIINLYDHGKPTDPVAVGTELARLGELGKVGGAGYLHTLIESVPVVATAGWYAASVAEKARARRVEVLGVRLGAVARGEQPMEKLAGIAEEVAALGRGGRSVAQGLPFVDGVAFTRLHEGHQQPLWGDLHTAVWARGESLMLFGPPGVGKSTLIHLLVWGRLGLLHEPVLGWPVVDDGGNVLYLAMDRPRQISRAMARLATPDTHPTLVRRLVVWQGPLPFDLARDRQRLAQWCEELGVTTVVVDSIKDAIPSPSDEEAAGAYNLARQVCLTAGVEWVESHHNRKAQGENKHPNTLDDVYGNRWLTAGAGSVLCLWGAAGDPSARLSQLKSPGEFIPAGEVLLDTTRGRITWADERPTVDAYVDASGRLGALPADVARVCYGSERDLETARRLLNKRVGQGLMAKYQDPATNLTRYVAVSTQVDVEIPPDDLQEELQ